MEKKHTFLSFNETRKFVRTLGIKTLREWRQWKKTNSRPTYIPSSPERTYKNEWISFGDFFGTKKANKNKIFLCFKEARNLTRTQNLKSRNEYSSWGDRPSNLPASPPVFYKNNGWQSWGDYLGTNRTANQNKLFISFEKARGYVHRLKFENREQYITWAKSDKRPKNIPYKPERSYIQKWKGWGDYLGTGKIANKDKIFLSFEETKKIAITFRITTQGEWRQWRKTNTRRENMPADPEKVYKKQGWTTWGDFLGTGRIATQNKNFLLFKKAKTIVQKLGFTSKKEYMAWHNRPENIPADPKTVYKKHGWVSWTNWLGCHVSIWTEDEIRRFVSDLLPYIDTLTPAGLYTLCKQASNSNSMRQPFMKKFAKGLFPKEELKKFANNEPSLIDEFLKNNSTSLVEENLQNPKHCLSEREIFADPDTLPLVETKNILEFMSSKHIASMDSEAADFFIKEAVARIWQHAFSDTDTTNNQLEQYNKGGIYAEKVKTNFLTSYKEAQDLKIPEGYSFHIKGKLCLPNLMQRYTACLVKNRKRIGNWSETGTGKTLSAILASRAIKAKITIICCPNSIVGGWETSIKETYPNSVIETKKLDIHLKENQHGYIILNYDFFQQPQNEKHLKTFLSKEKIDFIVMDEIHFSKQRKLKEISKRKKIISAMISEASSYNNNLHVLGMTATPVINNLREGKTLIELITGESHDDLVTKTTIENCIALYQKLISHGTRCHSSLDCEMNLMIEEIECESLLPEIRIAANSQSVANLELVLTKAKIPFIVKSLRPKTIIYSYYIANHSILNLLQEAIEAKGWSVGFFTGHNKEGLKNFITGNVDILIASNCIGTGVDGLQHVCNRLIINSLPWTHAEFKQLRGRIHRQGHISNHVDIIIPITLANINGQKWSWCESRWKRIQFKKSIADAAVDGIIPEGHLRNKDQALKDHALWLERIFRGEIYEEERPQISSQLTRNAQSIPFRKVGNLTKLNQRINTATSKQTLQRFTQHPQEFHEYHATYKEARKEWPVTPYKEAIKWCKTGPRVNLIIGDFGCGEAFLAKEIENKVHSFDHVSINEDVIACDMSHVPLEDACLDAAIFSLSLMGTNYIDYLKEAHRCLKLDGHLWIAEPTSRIQNIDHFKEILERLGFDIRNTNQKWKFTFIEALKSEREINEIALKILMEKNDFSRRC